jgi:hypothetical protein
VYSNRQAGTPLYERRCRAEPRADLTHQAFADVARRDMNSGVVPNIEEPLSADGLMNGEDNQLTRPVQCLQEGLPA